MSRTAICSPSVTLASPQVPLQELVSYLSVKDILCLECVSKSVTSHDNCVPHHHTLSTGCFISCFRCTDQLKACLSSGIEPWRTGPTSVSVTVTILLNCTYLCIKSLNDNNIQHQMPRSKTLLISRLYIKNLPSLQMWCGWSQGSRCSADVQESYVHRWNDWEESSSRVTSWSELCMLLRTVARRYSRH